MQRYILIIDDDYEDRGILKDCFTTLGLDASVQFIEDGLSLIKHLSSNSNQNIGLIVLDLNMPKLNGTETLRAIKKLPDVTNIPVIIFSTSVNEIEKKNCMELGAREYITKPLKWENYLDACRYFFDIVQERSIN